MNVNFFWFIVLKKKEKKLTGITVKEMINILKIVFDIWFPKKKLTIVKRINPQRVKNKA
tara:strand:- start:948 stop:1124 length:177 start_codon:yes stop_codon:yes gene_type:complete